MIVSTSDYIWNRNTINFQDPFSSLCKNHILFIHVCSYSIICYHSFSSNASNHNSQVSRSNIESISQFLFRRINGIKTWLPSSEIRYLRFCKDIKGIVDIIMKASKLFDNNFNSPLTSIKLLLSTTKRIQELFVTSKNIYTINAVSFKM